MEHTPNTPVVEEGNEKNMEKVREMMKQETADAIAQGSKATNTVFIDFTSDYGNLYQGNVVFKRPGVMDIMKMGAHKSEILRLAGVRDMNMVDQGVKYMAQVIATLKLVVLKSPEWLVRIETVEETDLLFHVFDKYNEWERSFRKTSAGVSAEGDSKPSE